MRFPLLAVTFAAGLTLSGCDAVKDNVGACPVVPPPKGEERSKPPVAEYEQTYAPGHWDWNGSGYVWTPGTWIKREGHSNSWMDGYWTREKNPGPCNWVPPHWM